MSYYSPWYLIGVDSHIAVSQMWAQIENIINHCKLHGRFPSLCAFDFVYVIR